MDHRSLSPERSSTGAENLSYTWRAERVAAFLVMTAEQINAAAEHMRLAVRNVRIERQKWIKRFLFL